MTRLTTFVLLILIAFPAFAAEKSPLRDFSWSGQVLINEPAAKSLNMQQDAAVMHVRNKLVALGFDFDLDKAKTYVAVSVGSRTVDEELNVAQVSVLVVGNIVPTARLTDLLYEGDQQLKIRRNISGEDLAAAIRKNSTLGILWRGHRYMGYRSPQSGLAQNLVEHLDDILEKLAKAYVDANTEN